MAKIYKQSENRERWYEDQKQIFQISTTYVYVLPKMFVLVKYDVPFQARTELLLVLPLVVQMENSI